MSRFVSMFPGMRTHPAYIIVQVAEEGDIGPGIFLATSMVTSWSHLLDAPVILVVLQEFMTEEELYYAMSTMLGANKRHDALLS